MIVSATSISVTVAKEKAVDENLGSNLVQVLCICYPINFGKKSMMALLNSGSKANALYLAVAQEIGLPIRPTDIRA